MTTMTTQTQSLLIESNAQLQRELLSSFNPIKMSNDNTRGGLFWRPQRKSIERGERTIHRIRVLGNVIEKAGKPIVTHTQFSVPSEVSLIGYASIPMMEDKKKCPMNKLRWDYFAEKLKPLSKEARKDLSIGYERTTYYTNILVVDDAVNPENNGKVFIYPMGKQVFDKFADAMQIGGLMFSELITADDGIGCELKVVVDNQPVPDGKTVPSYKGSMFNQTPTKLSDELIEKVQHKYDLEETLSDFIKPDSDELIKEIESKIFEVFGNEVNGFKIKYQTLENINAPVQASNIQSTNPKSLLIDANTDNRPMKNGFSEVKPIGGLQQSNFNDFDLNF